MSEQKPSAVVIWKITNFGIWTDKLQDELRSPYFSLDDATQSLFSWHLSLLREPKENKDKVYSIYLCRKQKNSDTDVSIPVKLRFRFSWKMDSPMENVKIIQGNNRDKDEDEENDSVLNDDKSTTCTFNNTTKNANYYLVGYGHKHCLDYDDQLKTKMDLYTSVFTEDNIIIICEIWNVNLLTNSLSSVSLKKLTSHMPVTEKCTFVWEIQNPLDISTHCKKTVFMENEKLSVTFSYTTLNGVKVIETVMSGSVKKSSSWTCCFTVSNNEVFLFESGVLKLDDLPFKKVYEPRVTNGNIFENQEKYLTNNSLVLNCCFSIQCEDLKFRSCTNEIISDPLMLRKIKSELEGKPTDTTLLEDLTQLYNDKTLSDFTLDVQSKTFSVHSALLIARSDVFKQMLQINMKETKERKLTIEDMDEMTVAGMLKFIYTDDPGNMTVEQALKLYYAGDKYKIDGLLKKCSDFLVENLTTSNVADVLELADKHSDKELMCIVHDYILLHEKEVLLSPEFEDVLKKNPILAAQTMFSIAKLKFSSASNDVVKSSDDIVKDEHK